MRFHLSFDVGVAAFKNTSNPLTPPVIDAGDKKIKVDQVQEAVAQKLQSKTMLEDWEVDNITLTIKNGDGDGNIPDKEDDDGNEDEDEDENSSEQEITKGILPMTTKLKLSMTTTPITSTTSTLLTATSPSVIDTTTSATTTTTTATPITTQQPLTTATSTTTVSTVTTTVSVTTVTTTASTNSPTTRQTTANAPSTTTTAAFAVTTADQSGEEPSATTSTVRNCTVDQFINGCTNLFFTCNGVKGHVICPIGRAISLEMVPFTWNRSACSIPVNRSVGPDDSSLENLPCQRAQQYQRYNCTGMQQMPVDLPVEDFGYVNVCCATGKAYSSRENICVTCNGPGCLASDNSDVK